MSKQVLFTYMKLEEIVNIDEIEKDIGFRKRAIANIQVRGRWFFSLFNQALKPLGLTEVQFNVLKILKAKAPVALPSSDISNLLISQTPDVTRILDRMVKKGLVKREIPEENRRLVLVSLTDDGLEMIEEAQNAVNCIFAKAEVWSEQEAKILNKLLNKLG